MINDFHIKGSPILQITLSLLIIRCSTSPQWKCLVLGAFLKDVFIMSISRLWPLHHSSTSRIRASPESPLPAKHLSTRPLRGSKACRLQLKTAQGEILRDTQTHSSNGTKLTHYFVMQSWGLRSRCSHKQKSELAHVLWEARLVPAASAGEEVIQGEGGWKPHFLILPNSLNVLTVI